MSPWRQEIRAQWRLAIPVVALQVGLMLMGVVDTLMMGRVSAVEMAGVAIGSTWHFGVLCFGLGTLQVLDPLVSQAFGAGDQGAIARAMQRGIVLALALSLPVALLVLCARPALEALGEPPEIVPIAAAYCRVSVFGVPPFLVFVALRQGLQAQHRMRPLVLTIVAANVLNAALDWTLIHGAFGFPGLGAVGCSLATVFARYAQVAGLFFLGGPLLRPHLVPFTRSAFDARALGRMLALGLPLGLQFLLEVGAFSLVALLMGRLSDEHLSIPAALAGGNPRSAAVAGHQVALNLASLAFMVPLGLSMAASVRVGNAIGRGDPSAAERAARVALVGGFGFMSLTSTLFLLLPEALARAYTNELGVIAVAATLIPLAGVFGVFDGMQVVAGGCLRGTGDMRFPLLVHLVGFWGCGIPLGGWLAFERGLGPAGLWWGLVAGLATVALILGARVRARFAQTLVRLRVEAEKP